MNGEATTYAPVVPYYAENASAEEAEVELHDLMRELTAADTGGPALTLRERAEKEARVRELKTEIERRRAERSREAARATRNARPRVSGPRVPAGAHMPVRRYWESDAEHEARNRRPVPRMSRADVWRVEAAIAAARADEKDVRGRIRTLRTTLANTGLLREPGPRYMPVRGPWE